MKMANLIAEFVGRTGAGVSGKLTLYEDKVVISTRKKIIGYYALNNDEYGIPIDQISEIEVQDAGILAIGYIRLIVKGDTAYGNLPKSKYKAIPHAKADPLGMTFAYPQDNKAANKFREEFIKLKR
jgi:hypothetical protein